MCSVIGVNHDSPLLFIPLSLRLTFQFVPFFNVIQFSSFSQINYSFCPIPLLFSLFSHLIKLTLQLSLMLHYLVSLYCKGAGKSLGHCSFHSLKDFNLIVALITFLVGKAVLLLNSSAPVLSDSCVTIMAFYFVELSLFSALH